MPGGFLSQIPTLFFSAILNFPRFPRLPPSLSTFPTLSLPRFPRRGGPPINRAYDVQHDI